VALVPLAPLELTDLQELQDLQVVKVCMVPLARKAVKDLPDLLVPLDLQDQPDLMAKQARLDNMGLMEPLVQRALLDQLDRQELTDLPELMVRLDLLDHEETLVLLELKDLPAPPVLLALLVTRAHLDLTVPQVQLAHKGLVDGLDLLDP